MGQPADLPCADLPLRLLQPPRWPSSSSICARRAGSSAAGRVSALPRPWDLHVLTQVVLTALTEGTRHREVKSRSRSPSKASSDPDLYTSLQSKSADSLGQGSPTSGTRCLMI